MISDFISKRVLTIGQTYANPIGGMASVIKTYSGHFEHFKFVSSYDPALNKWANIFQFVGGMFPLFAKLLLDRKIRLVHIHVAERGSFFRKYIVFFIAKRLFRKKVIFHSHGAEFHLFYGQGGSVVRRMVKSCVDDVDLVICLSRQWELFFKANFRMAGIEVLENIVDEHVNRNVSDSSVLEALFLGEIGDRKGVFDLIESIAQEKEHLRGRFRLRIGGKGNVDRLLLLIDRHGLKDIVSFEGWVSGQRKQSLLSEAGIYILPSYNEGLPISILEAMSYGIPIISTNVGGIPEVVSDGVNGFVIRPGDIEALRKSINLLVNRPELRAGMGKESLRLVKPYYAAAVTSKLQKIYESLL